MHRCKKISFLFYLLLPMLVISQQTEKIYLSGTGPGDAKQWQFFCTGGMNSGKWTSIAVPSCWEQQGFGKYNYGFDKDSVKGKEQGLYKYEFTASPLWKNKTINLVFEGVMTDAEVKVNGKSAGAIHQGAFYAFKYDITTLLNYKAKNLLEVTVSKHSANQSVNEAERKADFWIFGGIFRPVWLEVLPEIYIQNCSINAKGNGDFEASIFPSAKVDKANISIYDDKGHLIFQYDMQDEYKDHLHRFNVRENVDEMKAWTPEASNLYKAIFSIYKNGQLIHAVTKKFGFRTIEVKQRDGIYVNGVKVKMKGVNRSPFRPETGRTLSRENSIEDVQLMKDMNMNAVRCSHYPPDEHFLDACDSLGLFVIDELCGWHGKYDTPTGTKLVKEMIEHDANHPSIIMWANGNEGGHNMELDSLFTQFDIQQRPVIHPWQLFNGIETQHYREYNYGIGNYENGNEIIMPTEFLHGQFDGGHGAGLEDYWEKMWHDPLSAGGFLWDFVDQGIMRKDKNDSLDTDKFHAADGILGPHHEKEGSYYAIKEIWSPVYFEQKKIPTAFNGALTIENRFFFTNLNQCKFSFKLSTLGETNIETPETRIPSPSIKPFEKGQIKISLPKAWQQFYVLYVFVKDANGKLIVTKSFALYAPGQVSGDIALVDISAKTELSETDSLFILKADHVEIGINKITGLLSTVKNDKGTIPFNNGPVIQEGLNNFGSFTAIKENNDSNKIVISSAFDKKEHYNTLTWTFYPTGILKMEVHYFPGAYFTNFAGVNFSFPEKEITSVDYFGNGPYRVWKNRMKGGLMGIWHKPYNNTETGERWNYPEFKGYYSNVYWCNFVAGSQSFSVVTKTEDLFLRLFTPAWKTDQWHNYEPLFPSGDISFMQGISSIGTKTQRNETTGPMGMKNIFYDYEKDPARALKMVLYFNFNN